MIWTSRKMKIANLYGFIALTISFIILTESSTQSVLCMGAQRVKCYINLPISSTNLCLHLIRIKYCTRHVLKCQLEIELIKQSTRKNIWIIYVDFLLYFEEKKTYTLFVSLTDVWLACLYTFANRGNSDG